MGVLLRFVACAATLGTVGCAVTVLGVVGAFALVFPDGYPDPFVPYDRFMTGEVAPMAEAALCEERWHDPYSINSMCMLRLENGPFREIQITIHSSSTRMWTSKIDYWPRHLRVVDLVRHWGAPDRIVVIDSKLHNYRLMWNDAHVEAYATSARRFTNQASVSLVQWTF
jgi:hypothetical protein